METWALTIELDANIIALEEIGVPFVVKETATEEDSKQSDAKKSLSTTTFVGDDPIQYVNRHEVTSTPLHHTMHYESSNCCPSQNDVIFGKGGRKNHPGNVKFRALCKRLARPFLKTPTSAMKEEVARKVVKSFKGLFFTDQGTKGTWRRADFDMAVWKAKYLLGDIKKKHDRTPPPESSDSDGTSSDDRKPPPCFHGDSVVDHARSIGRGNLLDLVAWLDPDRIERQLLPADDAAVEELCALNLISSSNSTEHHVACFSLTRVVQAAARRRCGSPLAAIQALRANGLDTFSRHNEDTWSAAVDMLHHVDSIRSCYIRNEIAQQANMDQVACADLFCLGGHVAMWACSDYVTAQENYEVALQIYTQVYVSQDDPNNIRIAKAKKHLGRLYQARNDYSSACAMYKEALDMMRADNENASSTIIATLLHDIGRVHVCLDNRTEAEPYFCTSLRMKQELHESPTSIALTMANIARIHQYFGRRQEALAQYAQIEAMNGVNYRSEFGATTRFGEGQIYQDMGDLVNARSKYEEALETYHHVFGTQANNDAVAMAHCYLGSVLVDIGDLESAGLHLNTALEITRHVHGATANHENVANITYQIGRLCEKRGDKAGARVNFLEAKRMLE